MLGDGNEIDECGRALLRGDIIRITVESGEIAAYELLWSEDGKGRLNNEAYGGAGSAWDESWRYTVGSVEYVKDDQIIFCNSAAGSRPEFYKSGLFTIYIYDSSKPRDQRIMKGSVGDIHDRERYPESYDTVVIETAYSNGRELILIRNNDTGEE